MADTQTAPEEPEVVQGYLEKRGEKGLKGWRKRWFVLKEDKVFYFEKPKNASALGHINLKKAFHVGTKLPSTVQSANRELQVSVPGRVYYLRAATESERDWWLARLEAAREELSQFVIQEQEFVDHDAVDHEEWQKSMQTILGDIKDPDREGSLMKQGHFRKNWKSRWFVLKGTRLYYFADAQPHKTPKGVIFLPRYEVRKVEESAKGAKKGYANFELGHPQKKPFLIAATSDAERAEWFGAIAACLKPLDRMSMIRGRKFCQSCKLWTTSMTVCLKCGSQVVDGPHGTAITGSGSPATSPTTKKKSMPPKPKRTTFDEALSRGDVDDETLMELMEEEQLNMFEERAKAREKDMSASEKEVKRLLDQARERRRKSAMEKGMLQKRREMRKKKEAADAEAVAADSDK